MNRIELFNEVQCWLETEELYFMVSEEGTDFQVRMNIDTGLVQVRLLCEESPAMLQVICTLPVKVPKERTAVVALMLHNLNLRLRIGAFHLVMEDRLVTFRLAIPIRHDLDLRKQFREAFSTTLGTMDEHLRPLSLSLCSTAEAQAMVAKLTPHDESGITHLRLAGGRLELN